MLLERGRVRGFPCLFWKQAKRTLILENIALFECIYWLNSHFKCGFKKCRKAKKIFFPAEPFCMPCMKFLWKCPYSKKPVLPRKMPDCAPTFSLTFHPNFHPNILVFANLPIYRKLIHDNISLVFENQESFISIILKEM